MQRSPLQCPCGRAWGEGETNTCSKRAAVPRVLSRPSSRSFHQRGSEVLSDRDAPSGLTASRGQQRARAVVPGRAQSSVLIGTKGMQLLSLSVSRFLFPTACVSVTVRVCVRECARECMHVCECVCESECARACENGSRRDPAETVAPVQAREHRAGWVPSVPGAPSPGRSASLQHKQKTSFSSSRRSASLLEGKPARRWHHSSDGGGSAPRRLGSRRKGRTELLSALSPRGSLSEERLLESKSS